jgi:alanine racemase
MTAPTPAAAVLEPDPELLAWCEVSEAALANNMAAFRARTGPDVRLGVVVKSDAYGHGLVLASRAFLAAGADWLIVNSLGEAEALRAAHIDAPIYIVGHVPPASARRLVATGARAIVYDPEVLRAFSAAAVAAGCRVPVHIKIETGNHRQGLELPDALALGVLAASLPGITLEGISTHYADIEDTTDRSFAELQLQRFRDAEAAFARAGLPLAVPNTANSAATLLQPATHGGLVRVGIAAYGLWPSRETLVSALAGVGDGGWGGFLPQLQPALAWRARLAQVKDVPRGAWIGYGRTFRATHAMRIAIVPVGYHEGYDRRLSNLGHVLIHGERAPVRGRVCMNMMMVDVTDIPDAREGSIATLLGVDGAERVTAEDLAGWMQSINYEVVARIHPVMPRLPV